MTKTMEAPRLQTRNGKTVKVYHTAGPNRHTKFVPSFHTSNMFMREELENEINKYVNEAIAKEMKKQNTQYVKPSMRELIKRDNNSLLFKFFVEDVLINVYTTHHILERIEEREVDIRHIKSTLLAMEDYMQGTLLDRPNGHSMVVRNLFLGISLCCEATLEGDHMKIRVVTTLHKTTLNIREGQEEIIIQ